MTDLWYKSNLWRQLLWWSAWKATWQLCVKWEIIGIKMSFDDKFQFERQLLCEMCNNWETMWSLKWIELPILVLLFLGPITYLDKYTYWTLDSVFRRFWCVRNFIRANTLGRRLLIEIKMNCKGRTVKYGTSTKQCGHHTVAWVWISGEVGQVSAWLLLSTALLLTAAAQLLLLCRQVKAGGSLPWRNCIYAAVMLMHTQSKWM